MNSKVEAQKEIKEMLINSYQSDLISHAYIFCGKEGVGTLDMAYFLSTLLMSGNPDMDSEIAKTILNHDFPNVFYVSPDGQNIKKEQIDSLQAEFSKTSVYDLPRVYIINEAHKLNQASSNSLLKFIEEPTNIKTVGILITDDLNKILPTIKSRCQIVEFRTPNRDFLESLFMQNNIEKKYVKILPNFVYNVEDANELLNNGFVDIWNFLEKFMTKLSNGDKDLFIYYRYNEGLFYEKEKFILFLDLLSMLISDVIKFNKGYVDLAFNESIDLINLISSEIDYQKIMNISNLILETNKKLMYNVMLKMTILDFFIKLQKEVN